MSSPEGKIQTPEGRIILSQDLPQYEQSVQKSRIERATREEKEAEAAQKEYEKSEKAAEAQYQKDLAAYEKQIADAEKLAKQQNKYDAEIAKLEAEKQKALSDAHYSVWGPGGSRNRSELTQKQQTIQKNYDSAINKQVEQKRIQTGYQEFSIAYPGQVLPRNVAETFRSSPSFSLTGLYEQKVESKAAKAEYQRQASITTAQNIAAKQSIEYHSNIPNIGFISSGLGTERGSAVKPLPSAPEGKKAVQTRQRLTGVDTGQSIMGGQQASPEITITRTETYRETPSGPVLVRNVERTIPEKKASKGAPLFANPVAFVASLDRQNVDISGKPLEEKVRPQSNIEILKDTVSRYQALTGEQKAPYKSVLEASLIDKDRRIDPISKLFISQYALKEYKTQAEAYGLPEAKGRKGIIKKDGKQIFDMETGMGDVNIGRKLGFVYDYNLQRPTEEKPVLFEGSLQYILSPKVQGPQQPKFEEAVGAVGTIDYALAQEPKETKFNKSLENQYNKLGELQEITQRKAKSGDASDLLVQIAYAPSEAMRSVLGAGGSIVNLFEQNIDPLTEKQLNLKRTARPAPIIFQSDVSGTTVLPYDFEAQKWSIPVLDKSYELRQQQAIEKRGLPAYVFGIGFDYYGLKGVPTGIKGGVKLVGFVGQSQKLLLKGSEELQTVYKGVTFRNRPLIGIQQGRLRIGIDYSKIPYERIDLENPVYARSGMEASLGSGIERFTFYSRPALEAQKRKGIISEISQARAIEVTKGTEMGIKTKSKVGRFADVPFENLSKKQSDYLFRTTTQLQKQKRVEAVHGSVALGAQVPEPIKPSIKFGDIDIVPSRPTVEEANKLIDKLAVRFPLERGQRLQVIKPSSETANRQLLLFKEGIKEPEKILEVVLKGDEKLKSGESIVTKGTNILGFKIPFSKSVKEKSFGLKVHTANFQLLTNVKQALAYQKGNKELFDIYPSPGRTKDIARTYLNLKAKAIFKGGRKGKELDIQAEKIRSLYNIDFGDVKPEKIILSSSPQKITSKTNKIELETIPLSTPKTIQEKPKKLETKDSRIQSVKIKESQISITPSKIPSIKISNISSLKPSTRQISRVQSKDISVRQSNISSLKPSTRQISRVQRQPRSFSYKIKTPRMMTPPSRRSSSPPPNKVPPSQFKLVPPSKLTPPSRFVTSPPSRTQPSKTPSPPTIRYSIPPTTKKPIIVWQDDPGKRKKTKEEKQVSGIYLGNVPETQISGVFKRKEITLGKEKIEKTRRGDVRVLLGKKRETRKESKWFEGKKGDMFGFKNESKKRKTKFF